MLQSRLKVPHAHYCTVKSILKTGVINPLDLGFGDGVCAHPGWVSSFAWACCLSYDRRAAAPASERCRWGERSCRNGASGEKRNAGKACTLFLKSLGWAVRYFIRGLLWPTKSQCQGFELLVDTEDSGMVSSSCLQEYSVMLGIFLLYFSLSLLTSFHFLSPCIFIRNSGVCAHVKEDTIEGLYYSQQVFSFCDHKGIKISPMSISCKFRHR